MTHPLDEAMTMHGSEPNEDLSLRDSDDRCSRCGIRLHGEGKTVRRRGRFTMLYCSDCNRQMIGFMGKK